MNDGPSRKSGIQNLRQQEPVMSEPDKSRPATNSNLQNLPPEIMEEVVKNVGAAGPEKPITSARDLDNFRLVSKGTRDFVENTSALKIYHKTLNEAGSLARDLHDSTYPKNGLSEVGPDLEDMHEEMGKPVSAGYHVAAVAPTLKFQPPNQKSKVVNDVSEISDPDAKAEPMVELAKIIDDLDPKDRAALLDEAIKNFGEDGQLHTYSRSQAANTIVLARHHLQREQKSRVIEMMGERPELEGLIDSHAKSLANRQRESNSTKENSTGQKTGRTEPVMETLRERFEQASKDTTISAHERVKTMTKISTAISEELDNARADLMNFERSRVSRGR